MFYTNTCSPVNPSFVTNVCQLASPTRLEQAPLRRATEDENEIGVFNAFDRVLARGRAG